MIPPSSRARRPAWTRTIPSPKRSDGARAFADESRKRALVAPAGSDTFDSLALDIARFQYEYSPGFARLVAERGRLEQLADIPPVPTDAFRFTRVAVHPPDLDTCVYKTSGTTQSPGRHPVRELATKEHLTLLQAKDSLFARHGRGIVIALAPLPEEPPTSSLSHMMELFMREFDGRALSPDPQGAVFNSRSQDRWGVERSGVNVDTLHRAARIAIHRSEPLYILATSFALKAALDELDGLKVRTPSRTTVMITGGFKGLKTTLTEVDLRNQAANTLGVEQDSIVGEYGMTELGSQLFESNGLYVAPPWLRVQALDPVTLEVVPDGEPGLGHFLDLANIDSSVSVLTQDRIIVRDGGIELLGRAPRALPRGCSLPYEGLIQEGAP